MTKELSQSGEVLIYNGKIKGVGVHFRISIELHQVFPELASRVLVIYF